MEQRDTLLHLFAGGCGGTVGAIVTCPLEVIKTRLQSSGVSFRAFYVPQVHLGTINGGSVVRPTAVSPGLLQVLKSILEKEGPRSLFRGLGPNLVGVAPSSARGTKQMNAIQCAKHVYKTEGIRGFYRGLTASYAGISETMICFVIYETLKKHLAGLRLSSSSGPVHEKATTDFIALMFAAAISKGCASCIAYPHEVIRTRLREEGSKYRYFFQTARLVAKEEGYLAFYRGLLPQLIRQIPNTAIVLSTYEVIVYLLGSRSK
ncbi:solute carrier family 25 member 33 [Protopterus annectens]|uniref:solute carrier family 25 member 33 n=1 Tax=Protopterus annectens TaxID=7888 RepID=UPI001CFA566D|nr:solute carrier family 25 member 33 [Protopterus annectens]